MTTTSSLTDTGSRAFVQTPVDPTHVHTHTYMEQIFIKLPQGPGNFPDALPCPALVGLGVPGLGSLTLFVSLSLGATEAGLVSSCFQLLNHI